jgi:ankyrin repeat protein
LRDNEGRCCLHYAAGYGHEECVDVLLAKAGNEAVKVRDSNGDLPLHLAAQQGHPMCAYNIAKVRSVYGSYSVDR